MPQSKPPTLSETRGILAAKPRQGLSIGNSRSRLWHESAGKQHLQQPEVLERKVAETVILKHEIQKRKEDLRRPLSDLRELEKLYQTNMSQLNVFMEQSGVSRLTSANGEVVLEKKEAREKMNKESKKEEMLRVAHAHRVANAGDLVAKLLKIRGEKTQKSVLHVNSKSSQPQPAHLTLHKHTLYNSSSTTTTTA